MKSTFFTAGGTLAAALALSILAPRPAAAQVSNGSFETPLAPAGSFSTINAGGTMGAWTVGTGSIDLVDQGYWQAALGHQSVDMDGNAQGSIYQNLTTTNGQSYNLKFALAGNVDGGPAIKQLEVLWNGVQAGPIFTFDTTGHTRANMGWIYDQTSVVGTGSDRLTFQSLTPGFYGPAVDDVSLTPIHGSPVPEPGSMAMLATGGLPLLGFLRRRRAA